MSRISDTRCARQTTRCAAQVMARVSWAKFGSSLSKIWPSTNSSTIKALAAEVSALRQSNDSHHQALAEKHTGLCASIDDLRAVIHTQKTGEQQISPRLALFIDAENTSWKVLDLIMDEVTRHGTAIIRRSYGDFTIPNLATWKEPMAKHAILPRQVFQNTMNKNSSDSALMIDAVEILFGTPHFDAFCLVSSDADFTSLALRIREKGKTVIGIGRQQTAKSFVAACNTFVEIETLEATSPGKLKLKGKDTLPTPLLGSWSKTQKAQLRLLHSVILESTEPNGWGHLSAIGTLIKQRDPSFDPRKLGETSKLSQLLASLDSYEVKVHGISSYMVRVKA